MNETEPYFTKPLVAIFASGVVVMYLGLILKVQAMRIGGFLIMFPMVMYCISMMLHGSSKEAKV